MQSLLMGRSFARLGNNDHHCVSHDAVICECEASWLWGTVNPATVEIMPDKEKLKMIFNEIDVDDNGSLDSKVRLADH